MKRTIVTGARRGALVVVASLIILAGCSNPFQAGLGNNVDIDRPDGDIDSPDAGQYLSGVETLTGVHSDDTTTIPTVTLTLGDDPTEHAAAVDEDGWEYELNTTDLPDGELEVIITITDASGKSTEKRRLYYVDNSAPVVLVKNPQGYATNKFNGTVTVRGEAADRYAIDVVRVQILDDAGDELSGLDLADGTNSWTFEFDSRLYADPAADLQIVVQATDRAGNVSTTVAHYDDVLDQNGGQPITVEDLRRIAEGDSVAGAVIDTATLESVSMDAVPTSIDNDLDKPTVSFVSPQNGQTVGGSVLVTGTAFDDDGLDRVEMRIDLNGDGDYDDTFDLNGDGDETDDYETESNWVTLAGTVLWTQELNADGELYQVETGHNGQVAIQVRAVDINGIVGNPVEIAIRFDDTIPRVEGLEVDGRSFLNGISVSGTFPLRADIRDDEQVNRVRISYDGGITYRDVYNRSTGVNDGSITVNADNDLTLDKTIDTSNIPDIGDMEEGPLYIRLLVFDNNSPTPYQVLSYVTLNVDNVYPTGAWDTGNVDPLNVSGSDALVQGTAEDTGSVSGVEEVHVYFVDDGQVYDLSAYDTATPVVTTDFGDGNGNVAYTPRNGSGDDPPYEPPYYRIEIDNEIEGGDDTSGGGDGDGFDESLTLSGGVYTWSAQFDSTMIPDGPIDIHYVVFDSAGNGTHYVEPGFIKNNRPVIDSVEVGTDLDYSNAVEFGERFTYAETRFTARGRIYFNPTILGGNGATTYEVYNATDDPGLTSALTLSGNELDISATGENLSDQEYDFVIRVTDSVGIQVDQSISVTVYQEDTVAPSISITEEPVPTDGNVEPSSPYNPGNPALSGTVTVSGTASDDQRIQEIRLTAPGIGTDVLAASWKGGATNDLTEDLTGFTVESSLGQDTGHTVTWNYTWDTATHPNVAATGIDFEMSVQDYRSGTPDAITATQPYDIVPYVTDLEVGMESGTLGFLRRSAQGAWSIASSNSAADTFRITGYNLAPAAGNVTIGASALTVEATDTTGRTWVDVRKDSANSGPLTVTTAGVDSINNTNDDALARNQEAAIYYPDRTDDRFVRVWSLESKTGVSGMTEAVMHPNGARTDMDWLYVNNGQDLILNGTTLTDSWSLLGGDVARNDSGTLMWIFLHNMNWSSGETSYSYFGSVQWGKDEGYEVFAPNWHRAGEDRLGLGNLSFDGDGNYPYGNAVMERYRNLRILTDGTDTDTDNFVAYFDAAAESRSIVFWSFKTGNGLAAGDQVTTLANGWDSNLEKFTEGNTGADYSTWTGNTDLGLRTPFNGIARTEITSGGADSRHFSMAWDDANGILYLAYYDETSSELKLAYNLDPVGTPAAWTTRTTPIDTGAGLYVETAVDPGGGVHLAYFDGSQSNLKYAYLPSYNVADTAVERFTVDALFTNGMYNGITIRDFDETAGTDYRPVISSFSLSYSGTPYAIRTSWPLQPVGSFGDGADPATGNYTGDWETITVPAATPPQPVRSFAETDGTTEHQGRIVVGYNGGYIEEATLLDE